MSMWLLPLLAVALASCGGGGGGGGGNGGATAPTISSQPQSTAVSEGQMATFSVSAGGSAPLSYQWQSNGTDIAGATSSSYTTPALQLSDDGTQFTVVVKNSVGSKTSSAATLTVNPIAPSITAQPADVTVGEGQSALFSVTASGSAPLAYQWKRDGVAISAATSASFTYSSAAPSDNGAQFTVTVSNGAGSVTSNPATLSVNVNAPVITAQPSNVTVSAGQPAMFSVAVSGSAPFTYQWKLGGTAIPGATSASYSIPATGLADSGGSFTVSVTNGGGTVVSSAAILTVLPIPPSITAQPQQQSVLDGGTATFTVVASGTAPLTFQWRKNGANIPGANAAAYTTPAVHVADSGAQYSVAVSNPSGTVAVSAPAALTVSPVPPSITTQPQPQSVADGATATFSVVATGTGPLAYQWKKNGTAIGGATAAVYTTPVVHLADSGAVYSVAITNAAATGAVSSGATLTVTAVAPSITTQPLSQSIASSSPVVFTVTAAGSAPLAYQWKKDGNDIPGATSASYQISSVNASDAGSYTVVVSNGVPPAATSNAAILTITHTLSLLAGKLGGAGYDDGNGAAATFYNPAGLAVDAAGNIYLSDQFNQLIRKVSPTGDVTTIAGTPGVAGATNGTGASAKFNDPQQVAVDSDGNIYVADSSNQVIRMITPAGVVSTLAGRAGTGGSADGAGSSARFRTPSGIAVYQPAVPGPVTLVVADTGNNTIRLIDSSANVTTLAGTPGVAGATDDTGAAASFRTPLGLAVDQLSGTIYVADSLNNTVRQVSMAGVVTTLAGVAGASGSTDATGTSAKFRTPTAVAIDSAGANLYVADKSNHTIRQITIPGGVVTTLAGTALARGTSDGTGAAARFDTPVGVAITAGGDLFAADNINNVIRKITTPGAVVTTIAGNVGGRGFADGTGGNARFNNPHFVTSDAAGNLYVSDHYNNVIRKITPAGVVTTINGPFNGPYGVAVDASGNLYVADTNNNVIRKISPAGTVSLFAGGGSGFVDGTGAAAKFNHPVSLATDASGNLYIGDFDNNAVRMATPGGVVTTIAGSLAGTPGSTDGTGTNARFNGPRGLTVDQSTGNIYVTDRNNGTVRLITMPGATVTTFAGTAGVIGFADGTGAAAKFDWPNGPGLDAAGNLYVTDSNNHAIRKITPAGVVTTIVGAQPGAPLSYKVVLGDLPATIDGPSSLAVIPGNPVRIAITDATENSVLIAVLP